MIDNKIIKFGYGDILITGYNDLKLISFKSFYPSQKVSSTINLNEITFLYEITLKLTYKDYINIQTRLNKVLNKKCKRFTFKGYKFDFSNFNKNSIMQFKQELLKAMYFEILCRAC